VSEALRYMFKKGIVGRDRKDAKGFWYAFADVDPDHFEFYDAGSPMAYHIENVESKEIETVTTGYAQVEETKEFRADGDGLFYINEHGLSPVIDDTINEESKEISSVNIDNFNENVKSLNELEFKIPKFDIDAMNEISKKSFDNFYESIKSEHREPADSIQIGGDHYKKMAIQPWNALKEWMTEEQFNGFLKGSAIVYLARCDSKGGLEDIKKARHYLDKLIEVSEKGE